MKKIIALVLVAVFAVMALVACGGETGTCELCKKEDVKLKSFEGQKVCGDCYEGLKAVQDALGDLGL